MNRPQGAAMLAAVAGWMVSPATGANLITNPSFEDRPHFGVVPGWTLEPFAYAFEGTIWEPGCLTGVGNCPVEGGRYVSLQFGESRAAHTGYTTNAITVIPGQEYHFNGWWAGGSSSAVACDEATHFIGVRNGSGTSGSFLAREAYRIRQSNAGFTWTEVDLYFTAASSQVTVTFGWNVNYDAGLRAIHVDHFLLENVNASVCGTQHNLTGISANAIVNVGNDVTNVTIDGSNLENVDNVTLVYKDLDQVVADQSASSFTATANRIVADIPTSSCPTGKYDVVVTQPGCHPRVLSLGFEVICPQGSVQLATVQRARGESGTQHTFRVTGPNVSELDGARLVKFYHPDGTLPGGSPRPGSAASPIVATPTIIDVDTIELTADLTDAEAGVYRVEAVHPCGDEYVCGDIDSLQRAFLVHLPYDGTPDDDGQPKAVTNGSFEEGYRPDDFPPYCQRPPPVGGWNPKPLHWDLLPHTVFTGDIRRDGHALHPDCVGNMVKNADGDHYAGIEIRQPAVEAEDVAMFQTIDISGLLDGQNRLNAALNVRANFGVNGGGFGSTNTGFINLIDGTPADRRQTFSVQFEQAPDEFGLVADEDYNAVVPAGTVWQTLDPALLTVELRMTTTGPGIGVDVERYHALWVDHVRTGPHVDPSCRDPFADVYPETDGPQGGDGVVDFFDFAVFQRCFTGDVPGVPPGCGCLDHAPDGSTDERIDTTDFEAFQACFSGPAIAADPCCDGGSGCR